MADIEITVDGGTSKRLLTAGKYCDKNILVTATTGGGGEPEPPDDGKTRLYITVPANAMPDRPPPRNQVPLYIQQTVANGVTIDWGDGTAPETLPGNKNLRIDNGTGPVNTIHTYKNAGDYIITLDPKDECELGFGDYIFYSRGSHDIHHIMGSTNSPNWYLTKIYIGKNVSNISGYAFGAAAGLTTVTISNSVSKIYPFAFARCISLMSIIIPRSVLTIGEKAFNMAGTIEYHFFSETPPILEGDIFVSVLPDCIIYVPKGSAEAYKTATNWTKYADHIQEEPA